MQLTDREVYSVKKPYMVVFSHGKFVPAAQSLQVTESVWLLKTAGSVSQRFLRVVCSIETMKNGFLIVTIELK